MPIGYERDDVRRRVVVTVEGPFAVADFLAVIERQRGDGVWTYGMLYDLRGMTGEPAIDDLRQFMSEAERTTQPPGPVAILATHPAIYGRACTYASLVRAALRIGVFRDLDEAEQWLTAQAQAGEQGGE